MPVAVLTLSLDALLDQLFGSTPLLFVQEFLRSKKRTTPQVRIGTTRKEVRANLQDAVLSHTIGRAELEEWFHCVEGWGKQHLYLSKVPKRSLTHAHLLNTTNLRAFLVRRGFLSPAITDQEPASAHTITDVLVDDVLARITWRAFEIDFERRKDLDEVRELDDGEYEFRAHRRVPKRSASRFILRKTDGIALLLVDLPLGDGHAAMRVTIDQVAQAVLAPLSPTMLPLGPILSALDQGAVERSGPRPGHPLTVGVAPTHARYRADGARVEFSSTRESSGYTDSAAVRHVRRAMQVQSFVGEAGKFRLTFDGDHQKAHDMTVSLHAAEDRTYLFSRMTEGEVLALVDQFLRLG
jgi:hypothetical protein